MNTEEINISRKGTSDELYRELLNELGRYVYVIVFNKLRSCGTKEDVEECVSDVFAELFIIAEDGKCDDIRKMAGIIAKRRAVDYFRKLSVSQNKMVCVEYEEFSEFADTLNVEVLSDSNEVRRDILREIEALGEPDSTILMQKFYYNKTSSEIGKTLKMTASTVRSRCVRAIERLKISLASIGITRQEGNYE
ncbi:MAG: sigma-70 family RNA polymerase sigma factor [Ruminococcus sp.]|nr:sigma-70 family RNA polymerase sigma factor [Ruminococcus sp.]